MKRPLHEIVALYNAEIRGFYNYYSIANNVSFAAAKFGYIMEYSMYNTMAAKLNSSTNKIIDRYKVGNDIIVPYKDSKGKERHTIFYNGGFKRKDISPYASADLLPHVITVPQPILIERLKDGICELCGQKGELTMHHVRKLSLLKENNEWKKLMLKRHRKTMSAKYSYRIQIESCYQWRAVCMETCKYGLGACPRKPTAEKPQGVLYRAYEREREVTSSRLPESSCQRLRSKKCPVKRTF